MVLLLYKINGQVHEICFSLVSPMHAWSKFLLCNLAFPNKPPEICFSLVSPMHAWWKFLLCNLAFPNKPPNDISYRHFVEYIVGIVYIGTLSTFDSVVQSNGTRIQFRMLRVQLLCVGLCVSMTTTLTQRWMIHSHE